jgi:hypothetical protein
MLSIPKDYDAVLYHESYLGQVKNKHRPWIVQTKEIESVRFSSKPLAEAMMKSGNYIFIYGADQGPQWYRKTDSLEPVGNYKRAK